MSYTERKVTSFDNLSLYIRDYGNPRDSRAPLLCLGGLTRNCKDFEALAECYSADGRRVICPDYRGRGQSDYDTDWRNYDPRTYIRDIQDVMAALNVHHIIVIGTSLGGILGMGMAVAMPSTLVAVVMNDVGPKVETGGLGFIVNYIRKDSPHDDWDNAVTTIKTMLPNLKFQDESIWLKMAQNTFREGEDGRLYFDWDVDIVKPMLKSSYTIPDMWPLFRALKHVPTLVLRGAESDILSRKTFRQMQDVKPDMIGVEIPGVGHVPTLAEPESRAALEAFFASH